MSVNEMKSYLASYAKLKTRAEKLVRDIEIYPSDKKFLQPLLESVTETAEDIAARISAVENTENRELLFRKYINGETLEEIGDKLCYSARHVQRLINSAVAGMSGVE